MCVAHNRYATCNECVHKKNRLWLSLNSGSLENFGTYCNMSLMCRSYHKATLDFLG